MGKQPKVFTRRAMLQSGAAAVAAAAIGVDVRGVDDGSQEPAAGRVITKSRIRQSVVSWCFEPMKLETLARHAADIGLKAIENVDPKDWEHFEAARLGLCHDDQSLVRRRHESKRKSCHVHRKAERLHRRQRDGRLSKCHHIFGNAWRNAR